MGEIDVQCEQCEYQIYTDGHDSLDYARQVMIEDHLPTRRIGRSRSPDFLTLSLVTDWFAGSYLTVERDSDSLFGKTLRNLRKRWALVGCIR